MGRHSWEHTINCGRSGRRGFSISHLSLATLRVTAERRGTGYFALKFFFLKGYSGYLPESLFWVAMGHADVIIGRDTPSLRVLLDKMQTASLHPGSDKPQVSACMTSLPFHSGVHNVYLRCSIGLRRGKDAQQAPYRLQDQNALVLLLTQSSAFLFTLLLFISQQSRGLRRPRWPLFHIRYSHLDKQREAEEKQRSQHLGWGEVRQNNSQCSGREMYASLGSWNHGNDGIEKTNVFGLRHENGYFYGTLKRVPFKSCVIHQGALVHCSIRHHGYTHLDVNLYNLQLSLCCSTEIINIINQVVCRPVLKVGVEVEPCGERMGAACIASQFYWLGDAVSSGLQRDSHASLF